MCVCVCVCVCVAGQAAGGGRAGGRGAGVGRRHGAGQGRQGRAGSRQQAQQGQGVGGRHLLTSSRTRRLAAAGRGHKPRPHAEAAVEDGAAWTQGGAGIESSAVLVKVKGRAWTHAGWRPGLHQLVPWQRWRGVQAEPHLTRRQRQRRPVEGTRSCDVVQLTLRLSPQP